MSLSSTNFLPGAIYLRLSRDDEGAGESLSISNQRSLLLRYAREHHLTILREYTDDGYSGTTFDRPGFRQMIADIERGEIRLVLTKDLSRLGRDYIKTGEYTELFFPAHGVRFIAVGDGYDSAYSSTDLIPFRNVVNEMYARDISRKIRASLQVRMEDGSFIGSRAPYGYQAVRDTSGGRKLRRLTEDPKAAETVRFLFQNAAAGVRPSALARQLNEERIPSPSAYRAQKKPPTLSSVPSPPGRWTANTIIKLLHNPVYLGDMVQGKTRKLSFKSSLTRTVPPEERTRVCGTHPALVSEALFFQCQEQLKSRICKKH